MRRVVSDGQVDPGVVRGDRVDIGGAPHEQSAVVGDPLGVLPPVQLLDQRQVDAGVVGRAVVGQQASAHRLVGGVEVVDRGRVEDPIGVRAVVGGGVAVPREDPVHLGVREGVVQVGNNFRRALTGADHREPPVARLGEGLEPLEQSMIVEDPVGFGDAGGKVGDQPAGDDDMPCAQGCLTVRRGHLENVAAVANGDNRRRVAHIRLDLVGRPPQVVVEFQPRRKERLMIDEFRETRLFGQIVHKGEGAGGRPLCREVLEERDLHGRSRQQHAGMPAELALRLDEGRADAAAAGPVDVGIVFGDSDRQTQVGWPESESDDVERFAIGMMGDGAAAGKGGGRTDGWHRAFPVETSKQQLSRQ